jgi:hypothetical protein
MQRSYAVCVPLAAEAAAVRDAVVVAVYQGVTNTDERRCPGVDGTSPKCPIHFGVGIIGVTMIAYGVHVVLVTATRRRRAVVR